MEEFSTRRDIMEMFHISRRVIEGYEEIGLIKPSKNDERGGLLYDQETVNKIGFVRLCQKLGFELKDILAMIDMPNDELKEKLNDQANVIRRQMDNLRYLLKVTCSLAEYAEDPRKCERVYEIFKEDIL